MLSFIKADLKDECHQTPKVHVKTAPGHSFGLFLQQYPLHASLLLQLFWLTHQHPALKYIGIKKDYSVADQFGTIPPIE